MRSDSENRAAILSRDTSREAEELQVQVWRSLSTIAVARLIAGASRGARALALAGVRDRYPATPDELLVPRLAMITLGPQLARRVYPTIESVIDRSGGN
jgi:hypothetical protein